jgi:AcrR family transcriptional regulator
VVDAAVALADQRGIEALTMRNLSQALGVVPMAIYKHVTHKEELLDLMVDQVFTELEYDDARQWRTMVRGRALALREALVRHPWAVGLMESGTLGPGRLRDHDTVMRCLRKRAGLSLPNALHALSVLDGLVYGFALQQRAYASETKGDTRLTPDSVQTVRQQIESPDQYPYLNELVTTLAKQGYDYGREFAFGLDLLLDGIDRLR